MGFLCNHIDIGNPLPLYLLLRDPGVAIHRKSTPWDPNRVPNADLSSSSPSHQAPSTMLFGGMLDQLAHVVQIICHPSQ